MGCREARAKKFTPATATWWRILYSGRVKLIIALARDACLSRWILDYGVKRIGFAVIVIDEPWLHVLIPPAKSR